MTDVPIKEERLPPASLWRKNNLLMWIYEDESK